LHRKPKVGGPIRSIINATPPPPRAPSHNVALEHLLDSVAPELLLFVIAGEACRTVGCRAHLPERACAGMVMPTARGGASPLTWQSPRAPTSYVRSPPLSLSTSLASLSAHIVNLDTVHDVQWPPLLQAIIERTDSPPWSTSLSAALLHPQTKLTPSLSQPARD
jgi:hypothetical protein